MIQLRQTEHIGSIDDQGVGVRKVNTRFDDRCTQQHVKLVAIERSHHFFEFVLSHLAVTDLDVSLWNKFLQFARDKLDVFDPVVQIEDLTASI